MANMRELIRVLKRQEPGRPVLFEPVVSRPLHERLVWRSGATPWQGSLAAAQVVIDSSRICGLDTAALSFGRIEGGLCLDPPLLARAPSMLPPGMGILDMGPGGLLTLPPGSHEAFLSYYDQVLPLSPLCACLVRDITGHMPSDPEQAALLETYRILCQKLHAQGKYAIYSAGYDFPQALGLALEAGFDAIRYQPSPLSFEDCWREYHSRIALLGGLSCGFLSTAKPLAIHARCDALMALTGGKAMALGSDNLHGRDIPYLGFISLTGYVERHTR